ncbi:MAG TPA: fibronectin type III domain-containing protein, partial [Candidatus Binatia bacterium]|nr:fibronectin type III domain-containing protein [Candidatus Binatia bacterium]
NVFDGNTNNFYDAANGTNDWAGIDLGSGTNGVVMQIKYWPRAGLAYRMVGGQFQGANVADFSSGVVTLFTVSSTPPDGMNVQTVSNTNAFRYLRYIGPANGWCNVAEVEFWGDYASSPVAAPTGVSAAAGDARVTLNWNAVGGATGYKVKRSPTSGSGYADIATNATLSYTNTGLANGTLYYFVVSALNAHGESTNSAEVSARPTASAPAQIGFTETGSEIQLNWPADHTGWQLQSQTNSLATGLGTNWINLTGSDQTNLVPVPLTTTNGAVFFRLVRPY